MALQDEILQAMEDGTYSCYAIRITNESTASGIQADRSRRWYDGNPINAYEWVSEEEVEGLESEGYEQVDADSAEMMGENGYWGSGECLMVHWEKWELIDGTCGVHIVAQNVERAIGTAQKYNGSHILLIAGDDWEEGNDRDEAVINAATIIGCWRR